MTADAETRAFYDAEATAYAARHTSSEPTAAVANLAKNLAPGARILDLGCGGGQASAALRDMGFEVVSVDASPGLAAEASRRWGLDVRVLDFADLDDISAFDAVCAFASLHHARGEELPSIFARIRGALKPGGILHATLKADAHDRRDRFGRFYCAMDEASLRALVADWTQTNITSHEGYGYDREPTTWLMLEARR
jgi:SAM-dependent methyltransferase